MLSGRGGYDGRESTILSTMARSSSSACASSTRGFFAAARRADLVSLFRFLSGMRVRRAWMEGGVSFRMGTDSEEEGRPGSLGPEEVEGSGAEVEASGEEAREGSGESGGAEEVEG